MGKLVILTERNIDLLLSKNGIKPEAVYSDIEKFSRNVQYFKETNIVVIITGLCEINIPIILDLTNRISIVTDDNENRQLLSYDIVTDIDIKDFKNRNLYRGMDLKNLVRIKDNKVIDKKYDLFGKIDYTMSDNYTYYNNSEKDAIKAKRAFNSIKPDLEYLKLKSIYEKLR